MKSERKGLVRRSGCKRQNNIKIGVEVVERGYGPDSSNTR
jgi:hypothetical protein